MRKLAGRKADGKPYSRNRVRSTKAQRLGYKAIATDLVVVGVFVLSLATIFDPSSTFDWLIGALLAFALVSGFYSLWYKWRFASEVSPCPCA